MDEQEEEGEEEEIQFLPFNFVNERIKFNS